MSRNNWRQRIVSVKVIKILLMYMVFVVMLAGSLPPAEAATVTLKFESQALDLDTGEVVEWGLKMPDGSEVAEIYIAYNSDRFPHAVVALAGGGLEVAVVQGLTFDMMTAQEAANLTYSVSAPDIPFTKQDTIVIKTAGGAVYKLGRSAETAEDISFEYELIFIQ